MPSSVVLCVFTVLTQYKLVTGKVTVNRNTMIISFFRDRQHVRLFKRLSKRERRRHTVVNASIVTAFTRRYDL